MDCRHNGIIVQSMVYGSTVPAQGRFRRQIGTESCHRFGSYAYRHEACRFVFAGVSARCLVGLCSYAYRHEACRDNVLGRDLERQ